jgi:hypothetical protein
MNRIWKDNEKQFVRDNANSMKDEEIAKKLTELSGRTVTLNAVRKMRQKLGLRKKCGRGKCELAAAPPTIETEVLLT